MIYGGCPQLAAIDLGGDALHRCLPAAFMRSSLFLSTVRNTCLAASGGMVVICSFGGAAALI